MTSKLRTAGYVLFFLAILGNTTHVISSNLFLLAIVIAVGLVIAHLAAAGKFPFNKTERLQGQADRTASFAEPIPAGCGVIYAMRQGKLPGAVVEVSLDGTTQADVAHASFAKWTVPAGPHTLRANGKGANAVPFEQASTLAFSVVAGQKAFFTVKVGASLSRFTAELVEEPESPTLLARLQELTLTRPQPVATPLTF